MHRFAGGLLYLVGGALVGAVSAYAMIQNAGVMGLGSDGPWLSRSTADGSPPGIYVQSYYLLSGRLPAAPGQLVEATAERDSKNEALSASCTYVITSIGALPQWWSLAALPGGSPASGQAVLDVAKAVREADGTTQVVAAPTPQPGNWLKLPAGRQFSFLYLATPTGSRNSRQVPPFRIAQKGCR